MGNLHPKIVQAKRDFWSSQHQYQQENAGKKQVCFSIVGDYRPVFHNDNDDELVSSSSKRLTRSDLKALAKFLSRKDVAPHVHALRLSHVQLGLLLPSCGGVQVLSNYLSMANIIKLYLGHNLFGPFQDLTQNFETVLLNGLERNSHLQELWLHGNGLARVTSWAVVRDLVAQSTSLRILNVGHNCLNTIEAATVLLHQGVLQSSSLQELHLWECDIDDAVAIYILDTLSSSSLAATANNKKCPLKLLNLSLNPRMSRSTLTRLQQYLTMDDKGSGGGGIGLESLLLDGCNRLFVEEDEQQAALHTTDERRVGLPQQQPSSSSSLMMMMLKGAAASSSLLQCAMQNSTIKMLSLTSCGLSVRQQVMLLRALEGTKVDGSGSTLEFLDMAQHNKHISRNREMHDDTNAVDTVLLEQLLTSLPKIRHLRHLQTSIPVPLHRHDDMRRALGQNTSLIDLTVDFLNNAGKNAGQQQEEEEGQQNVQQLPSQSPSRPPEWFHLLLQRNYHLHKIDNVLHQAATTNVLATLAPQLLSHFARDHRTGAAAVNELLRRALLIKVSQSQ